MNRYEIDSTPRFQIERGTSNFSRSWRRHHPARRTSPTRRRLARKKHRRRHGRQKPTMLEGGIPVKEKWRRCISGWHRFRRGRAALSWERGRHKMRVLKRRPRPDPSSHTVRAESCPGVDRFTHPHAFLTKSMRTDGDGRL